MKIASQPSAFLAVDAYTRFLEAAAPRHLSNVSLGSTAFVLIGNAMSVVALSRAHNALCGCVVVATCDGQAMACVVVHEALSVTDC